MKNWKFALFLAAVCSLGMAAGCNNEDETEVTPVTPDETYVDPDPATDPDALDPAVEPDIVDPVNPTTPDTSVPHTNVPTATGTDPAATTTDQVEDPAVREVPPTDIPEKLEEGAGQPPPPPNQ